MPGLNTKGFIGRLVGKEESCNDKWHCLSMFAVFAVMAFAANESNALKCYTPTACNNLQG